MRGTRPVLHRSLVVTLAGTMAVALGLVAPRIADGPDTVYAADVASVTCDPVPTAPTGPSLQVSSFTGDTPRRLVDTRNGTGGVSSAVGDGCTLRIDLDAAGVPDEALALSLSVTALGERSGFQQVFPCDRGRPATSNVNNRPDRFPTPNLVVGQPDDDREICVFTLFAADLIVDLSGWWTEEGDQRFRAVEPVRVDDSRQSTGIAPGGGTPRPIDLSSFVPEGTTSIVANLTVARPAGQGFLTIFPCSADAPLASNLNFRAGESRAVSVVVGLDADRRVCTSSNVEHHVILDLAGYYADRPQFGPAAELRPEPGTRLADSRNGTGGWSTPLAAGETRSLDVSGALPDASQVTGLIVNVTAVGAQAPGFLTVARCGADPDTSSVNYAPGTVASNLVTVDLGTSASLCVFSLEQVDVVVDLFGVFRAENDDLLVERLGVGGYTWPLYRPDAQDYVTECSDPLALDLDLLPGTRARVNGVSVPTGLTQVDLAGPEDLVRVELRRGSTVHRHHFRCVPADFRRAEVDVFGDPEPGWYLTTIPAVGDGPARAVILDEFGAPVWFQETEPRLAVFERAGNGNLLALPIRGQGLSPVPDRGALEVRLDGSVVREWITVDDPPDPPDPGTNNPVDHHDVVELPGGGVALISYPLVRNVDLTALDPSFTATEVITDNIIQELDANGDLVWEWRMSDHFAFDKSGANWVYAFDEVSFPVTWTGSAGHPGEDDVDVFHINALELAGDGSGDYIVTARHVDAVFRIDRTTGDVEWILRSDEIDPTEAKSGADTVLSIVGDPGGGPRRPHDAILDGDTLTFLDNRFQTGEATRAATYRIDPVAGTATLLDFRAEPNDATSFGLGSFRPGPDGSSVISWGGPVQPMFQQFDAFGTETMRFLLPDGGNPFRVVWYPKSAFNVVELRAESGGSMRIPS